MIQPVLHCASMAWMDICCNFFFQTSWGRVCTQHCASRATSTTGLSAYISHRFIFTM